MRYDNQFIEKANRGLESKDVNRILDWAFETFGDDVGMTTAFGYSGVVLLHHVLRIKPDIALYFIDTGFHFQETIDFAETLAEDWKLNLKIIKPQKTKQELENKLGSPPYRKNPDLCCYYNKVKPLLTFLEGKKVWLSAIRRDQASTRSKIQIVDLDGRNTLKLHPLYNWRREDLWEYIEMHNLPYNPLHNQNFISIGCQPCTVAVDGAMHEREGRWPHNNKVECGINMYAGK